MRKRSKTVALFLAAFILSTALTGGFFDGSMTGAGAMAPTAGAAAGISGFVYEAVRSNRIEGAQAKLYYENAAGNVTALEDGTENPVATDKAGAYRWNVPAGKWKIGVTKQNYKPAYSGWTAAASQGNTIAIPIVSTLAPTVQDVIEKKDCYTVIFSQYMDINSVNTSTVVFKNNGKTVGYTLWPADREESGEYSFVYYARSFNFMTDQEVTSLTVNGVKNYAGIKLPSPFSISTADIRKAEYYTPCDVDGDGKVTSADARIVLRASVGLFDDSGVSYDFREDSKLFLTADCDNNGKIEAEDARKVLRVSVGLEKTESNSSLVTYTHLTDKHDDRTHKIDKITIHHMAEKRTAKQCCDYFCATAREVSANYCIGYDGSVALNVEEKYRAWTSSCEANDTRAITIEVSNDSGEPNWHVSDVALQKLIDLCVDICRRNNIHELVFTGDAYGNLTMHRMFVATGCPGPYLGGKFPYIAAQVNQRLAGG